MMNLFLAVLLLVGTGITYDALASTPSGTWSFDRAVDYDGRQKLDRLSGLGTLTIRDGVLQVSHLCRTRFRAKEYFFSDVFQALSKGGVDEKQLDNFSRTKLKVLLSNAKTVYEFEESTRSCALPITEFFVIDDRLIIPLGASLYSYVKVKSEAGATTAATTPLSIVAPYKFSRLPMDFDKYVKTCEPKILDRKGVPKTSDKCAPDFYPYVADPKSADPLMKTVGNHDYAFNGQEYTQDFSPPFAQKRAATFLVFPPMKRVVLVRVDDFERVRSEEREVMSGVYLSIVNGKVVDQIQGCDFDQHYVCLVEGTPEAKLTESGRFQPIKRR